MKGLNQVIKILRLAPEGHILHSQKLPVRGCPVSHFTQKVLAAILRWKITAAILMNIVGAVLLGVQVNQAFTK